VTIEVKDLAGNSATYPAGQLTYDMSFPQLTSAIVIPEKVNSSSADVKVQFSFSEDVMINVDEVFITAANFGPELALNCNTGPDYKKSFTCSHSFESLDSRVEDYNVTVTARDRAGNQVADLFTGSVSVDREKPYITSSGIDPVSVRQNEPFTITFGVNEQLDAAPVVKIGDKEIPGTECSEVSAKNYSCTHTANGEGDETDGVKSVTVNLRDPAGNLSIITLPGNVTYDATRPELLNPVIIPEGTANKYNSVIQVRFSFSEKIDHPAFFNFYAVSSKGGTVPPFTCTPVNSNNQSFTCQASFADEDDTVDTFSFKVAASDLAGNELNPGNAPEEIGTLNIDRKDPEIVFESVTPSVVNAGSSNVTVIFSVSETLKEAPAVTIGNELSSNVPSAVSGL
ncbi:MAG TPA: hypothetical protein P5044_11865, partial [bacterium]|nr:hypothetical protein [bacterium]